MSYFANAEEVYRYIGRLFVEMMSDPGLAQAIERADTVARFSYTEPDATITISMRHGEEPRVEMGESDVEPEVVMTSSTDVAHRFWLGEVNITVALARGQMHASGPVTKVLRLVPLAKPMFPRYRARLEAEGRSDLLAH